MRLQYGSDARFDMMADFISSSSLRITVLQQPMTKTSPDRIAIGKQREQNFSPTTKAQSSSKTFPHLFFMGIFLSTMSIAEPICFGRCREAQLFSCGSERKSAMRFLTPLRNRGPTIASL
jgi:hypothetical protein